MTNTVTESEYSSSFLLSQVKLVDCEMPDGSPCSGNWLVIGTVQDQYYVEQGNIILRVPKQSVELVERGEA